jgi:hypothetical protein
MALSFADGDFLYYGTVDPVASSSDWSMFTWIYMTSFNARDNDVFVKRDAFNSTGGKWGLNINSLGQPTVTTNGHYCTCTGLGLTANQWNAVGLCCNSSGVTFWVNGASSQTSSNNNTSPSANWQTPTGCDSTGVCIGKGFAENADKFIGDLAYVSLWGAALSNAECASLNKGFSPRSVRPQNLAFFTPLLRDGREIRHGYAISSSTGTAFFTHPKVFS